MNAPKSFSVSDVVRIVDFHMRGKYRRPLSDLKPTSTPGYWEAKNLALGEFPYTYTYFDSPRQNGRFASVTRSWAALVNAGVEN